MTIKVIGAGIGRTGTTTLKLALEQLGFAKCYHMDEIHKNPRHTRMWLDAAKGKSIDWDTLFAGYQATVDLPTYALYETLMRQYPDAKVILTMRDAESWYASAAYTIFQLPPPHMMIALRFASLFNKTLKPLMTVEPVARKIGIQQFFNNDLSKENAIEVFNEHNEKVKQTVPADRLLVYEVTQEWEPLCEFLGVPVPDAPFPNKNTREDFGKTSNGN